ncbi:MAG: hypothetical protein KJ072_05825 [Verrucomicrobia bacterium]|nr:hypothetical protein [Verrucomicrobiota bacterium]
MASLDAALDLDAVQALDDAFRAAERSRGKGCNPSPAPETETGPFSEAKDPASDYQPQGWRQQLVWI